MTIQLSLGFMSIGVQILGSLREKITSLLMCWFWLGLLAFFTVPSMRLCVGKTADNIEGFFIIIVEQGLHSVKAFSASCTALPARRIGMHKNL